MRNLLKRLQGMGKTILVSSHILPELADICNRVGIIEYGQLLACGGVKELLASVRGRPVIRIRLNGPVEPAAELLSGCDEVESVDLSDDELRVTLREGLADHAPLIARLVAAGHGILEVREQEIDLETAFLRLTRGALAKPVTD